MNLFSFFTGAVLMIIGLLMVSRSNMFLEYFGDVADVVGTQDRWSGWKLIGLGFLLFGFLWGFGLLQAMFFATIGKLFTPGIPEVDVTSFLRVLFPFA